MACSREHEVVAVGDIPLLSCIIWGDYGYDDVCEGNMMDIAMETAVLTKMRRLPDYRRQEVLTFIEFLESKLSMAKPSRQEQLATAAQALLVDYESDSDLIAFTALDGDAFYA